MVPTAIGPSDAIMMYLLLASMPYTGKSIRADWGLRGRKDAEVARPNGGRLDRGFVNRVMKWELKYIPRGDKGSLQNSLRFSYNILRRKHMAQRKSRHETLKELVEKMKRIYPDFTPLYDNEIFKIWSSNNACFSLINVEVSPENTIRA